MIIIRYLVRETLKSQLAILFILLLIFFCQKLVRVLDAAVNGDIPTNLVLSILSLGVPDMAQLILPLSLFLALLMSYGKLHMEHEITVMHACGFGKRGLLTAALLLASFTAFLSSINTMWLLPWSDKHQEVILAEAKANPSLAALLEGKFQTSRDGAFVLFVGDVKGNQFKDIFLAQLHATGNRRPSIVMAEHGYMKKQSDGSQLVYLDEGTRYEGTAMLRDFRITHFVDYEADMGYHTTEAQSQSNDVAQSTLVDLWKNDSAAGRAEFHWRMTLVVAVFLMGFLVVPLSEVNPRQGRVVSMLPAILLYLIYFLLQSSFRSNGAKGKLDPEIWVWVTNVGYFVLALVLNLWDSLSVRRIRARLRGAM